MSGIFSPFLNASKYIGLNNLNKINQEKYNGQNKDTKSSYNKTDFTIDDFGVNG